MVDVLNDAVMDNHLKQLTLANNDFAVKLFTEVAKKALKDGKSAVMSGFSALCPLAQLALASAGESHDEILGVIGMPDDDVTKNVFSAFNRRLRSVQGVELKVANQVYIPHGFELNDSFAEMSKDVFDSGVVNLNFSNADQAAATINNWVEQHTNNRIKDLLSPEVFDESTRAVLVNAIFFKGIWKDKFVTFLTRERYFHVDSSKLVLVPIMHTTGKYKLGESDELQSKLLELPYEGEQASMLVILPYDIEGIGELQQKLLDPSALRRACDHMFHQKVNVALPKFKIETTIDLKEVLQNMGISKLFNGCQAKLDHLLKKEAGLYISHAIQKAFIEVNEEGTEAAAASAFVACRPTSCGSEPPPKEFVADHPFIFCLKYHDTILFTGAVNNF